MPDTLPYIESAEVVLRYADGTSEAIAMTGRHMTGAVRLAGSGAAPLPIGGGAARYLTGPHLLPIQLQFTVDAPDDCQVTAGEPVLGFVFGRGPEVPQPVPVDFTLPAPLVDAARRDWQAAIEDAIRGHDAWGLLRTRPDGDVSLFDVVTPGSTWAATGRGGTVHLLLAREAPARRPSAEVGRG